jgi:hypothetical protein
VTSSTLLLDVVELDRPEAAVGVEIGMLRELEREEAVAPLTALLADPKQDMQTRGEALRALKKIKKFDDAALLLFLLDCDEPGLVKLVEDALKKVAGREFNGDAAAIRAWIKSNPDKVRKM